jgi:hypothetical protein
MYFQIPILSPVGIICAGLLTLADVTKLISEWLLIDV